MTERDPHRAIREDAHAALETQRQTTQKVCLHPLCGKPVSRRHLACRAHAEQLPAGLLDRHAEILERRAHGPRHEKPMRELRYIEELAPIARDALVAWSEQQ